MQTNRFKGNAAAVSSQKTESSDNVFFITLGSSLLLHALLLFLVLNVKLPPPVSHAEYADWVSRIAEPVREATVAPIEEYVPPPQEGVATEDTPATGASKQGGGGGGGKKAGGGGGGGGTGGGGVRQAVSGSGVLGVIGVASEGGGDFADVFSSSSGGVSEDVGSVMEGKKGANLASSGNIGRKQLGGGDGQGGIGGSGVGGGGAGIGEVGVAAGGQVQGGRRSATELKGPLIGTSDANILSGGLDKKAASAVIAKKSSGFRRCYERGLKADPSLHGKLVFEISIGDEGRVIDVRFTENTMHSKEVSDCVKSILMRLVFSKSESGIALLRNTLVFEAQQ